MFEGGGGGKFNWLFVCLVIMMGGGVGGSETDEGGI